MNLEKYLYGSLDPERYLKTGRATSPPSAKLSPPDPRIKIQCGSCGFKFAYKVSDILQAAVSKKPGTKIFCPKCRSGDLELGQ